MYILRSSGNNIDKIIIVCDLDIVPDFTLGYTNLLENYTKIIQLTL